jgi:hypothetical protein
MTLIEHQNKSDVNAVLQLLSSGEGWFNSTSVCGLKQWLIRGHYVRNQVPGKYKGTETSAYGPWTAVQGLTEVCHQHAQVLKVSVRMQAQGHEFGGSVPYSRRSGSGTIVAKRGTGGVLGSFGADLLDAPA